MSGFLDTMARSSRDRVAKASAREPLPALRHRALSVPAAPSLRVNGSFDLIAEYKRRSPSAGELGRNGLHAQLAAYSEGGAAAVSVLTEPGAFRGDLADAASAADLLGPHGIPVLRKDFLVDPYQLYESRAIGAGGVLLIVRMLSGAQLAEMLDCAQELGLFVLLEVFDTTDIAGIPQFPARDGSVLVGVNCRDLRTLDVVPQRFHELASMLPGHLRRVAESGINTPDDCADAARQGYDLALIGSALMRSADPAAMLRTMLAAARSAARVAA
ncbi:MAG: indole-3-glycerol-phosphate synthase [Pseudomonadota bacterium]|nr:indole-3-glycerol-phosphate synthase [Pseudomonadota bacterium]